MAKDDRFAMSRNFLATDKVPDAIFGIPVVSNEDDYTPEDLAFFREHPEAGGYYDMGEDASSGDGSNEADLLGGVAKWFGKTGKALDAGIAWMERQAAQTADMDVPLLSSAAKMLQPAYVGARAAIANMTSGGGKYYQPKVRDERYFSQDALREIGRNVGARRVEMSGRPGAWEASQSVGGFSVQDGKVTDKFDINRHYDVVPDAMTSLVGSIFGRDSGPDAGKVKTEIPLDKLPRQDAKGGEARGKYPGSLNNPGNVEKRAERRRGEIASPHKRWARFATPQDGLREMADVIRQIADVKLAEKDRPFTIRNFAEVYAPRFNEKGEPENDTDKYIRDVSSTSGIGADTVLDRWNTDDMARLMKTIVRFESGAPHSEWFTDDEYRTAARELEEGATD